MNERAGAMPAAGPDDPTGSPGHDGPAPRPWGCLKIAGTLVLGLGGLAVLAVVWLYISFQQSYKAPEGVPAQIAWTSHDVVLSPGQRVVRGKLTITASAPATSDLSVGVNAGVPSTTAIPSPTGSGAAGPTGSPGPAALLSGPSVRVTAETGSGSPQRCTAPCEVRLPSGLGCDTGTCRVAFDVTIELMSDAINAETSVTVRIAGGATARLGGRLPDGLMVELVLDGGVEPGES